MNTQRNDLLALVERWRNDKSVISNGGSAVYRDALDDCADELAATLARAEGGEVGEDVGKALDLMDSLLDPVGGLLTVVPYTCKTTKSARDGMKIIRSTIATLARKAARWEELVANLMPPDHAWTMVGEQVEFITPPVVQGGPPQVTKRKKWHMWEAKLAIRTEPGQTPSEAHKAAIDAAIGEGK